MGIFQNLLNKTKRYLSEKDLDLLGLICILWITCMMLFFILSTVAMLGHSVYCSVIGTELFCHAQHSVVL